MSEATKAKKATKANKQVKQVKQVKPVKAVKPVKPVKTEKKCEHKCEHKCEKKCEHTCGASCSCSNAKKLTPEQKEAIYRHILTPEVRSVAAKHKEELKNILRAFFCKANEFGYNTLAVDRTIAEVWNEYMDEPVKVDEADEAEEAEEAEEPTQEATQEAPKVAIRVIRVTKKPNITNTNVWRNPIAPWNLESLFGF